MKPTSSFKMSGQSKRLLALLPFRSQEDRNAYKKMLIQAQLAASVKVKTKGPVQTDNEDE